MNKEIYNLTTLTDYLNKKYQHKKSGKPFNRTDVQGYIKRGHLPEYMGNISIVLVDNLPGKIYKLVK